jgi:hypothetical protein
MPAAAPPAGQPAKREDSDRGPSEHWIMDRERGKVLFSFRPRRLQKTSATMMMMTMRAPMLIVTLRPMSCPLFYVALR